MDPKADAAIMDKMFTSLVELYFGLKSNGDTIPREGAAGTPSLDTTTSIWATVTAVFDETLPRQAEVEPCKNVHDQE